MDSLKSILPKVLHRRGLHGQATASHVTHAADAWLRSALPHLIDAFCVEKLSHATLSISCTHGIAAQECTPLLPALREYLARQFPSVTVTDIRLSRSRSKN